MYSCITKAELPIPHPFTWAAYQNNVVYLEVDSPAHCERDPLPISGWHASVVEKVRPKRYVQPVLEPGLLLKCKRARAPRSLIERLPLQWSMTKTSSHPPKSLPNLPPELSSIIIRELLKDARKPILRACTLALVCVPWARLIHASSSLWAWLMQFALNKRVRFIVSQLARIAPLHITGSSFPREFRDYLYLATSIKVMPPHDNDWIAALSRAPLPSLSNLVVRHRSFHHLRLDAQNLESLELGARLESFNTPRLRRLRLLEGFRYSRRVPGDEPGTWTRTPADTMSFFSLCRHITELTIDEWHYPARNSSHDHTQNTWHNPSPNSWQEVLQPLSGGPLRVLTLNNRDGVTWDKLRWQAILRFPSLEKLTTRSLLKLQDTHRLSDADVLAVNFDELVELVRGFEALRSLVFFIEQEIYDVSELPLTLPDIDAAHNVLPALRTVRCESNLGAHALRFLLLTGKRQFIDAWMDIPTIEPTYISTAGSCLHFSEDKDGVQRRINVLQRLLLFVQHNLSNDTTLDIDTYAPVGQKAVTKFSIGPLPWLQLSVEADKTPMWCECTFESGYSVSSVHAFTAFASPKITTIRTSLHIPMEPYTWGYELKTADVNGLRTGSYASWSPWDPFHAPDVDSFSALRQNLRMMSDVKELTITVCPSMMSNGNTLLKALLTSHEVEYQGPEHATTFPKLSAIHIHAGTQKSLAIGDPRHRIWEQVYALLDLRGKLADTGRCASLQRLVLEGNFCHCRNPGRTASAIAKLGACAEWILPEEGCQNCS